MVEDTGRQDACGKTSPRGRLVVRLRRNKSCRAHLLRPPTVACILATKIAGRLLSSSVLADVVDVVDDVVEEVTRKRVDRESRAVAAIAGA